jgi:hypothetical protein
MNFPKIESFLYKFELETGSLVLGWLATLVFGAWFTFMLTVGFFMLLAPIQGDHDFWNDAIQCKQNLVSKTFNSKLFSYFQSLNHFGLNSFTCFTVC